MSKDNKPEDIEEIEETEQITDNQPEVEVPNEPILVEPEPVAIHDGVINR